VRRTPLARGTSQLRRTPLAQVGRKTKSKASRRAACRRTVLRRDVSCRFVQYMGVIPGSDWWSPCSGHEDVHEICARSVWPDGDLEPDNCVLLCRHHHHWLDSHRDLAVRAGLYRRSKP
jgi:hypothetical protein